MPDLNSPPLIMAWGDRSTQNLTSSAALNVYADFDQELLDSPNWSKFMSQFSYLQGLLSSKEITPNEIDLIWVGINESIGSVGGAAGSQAFVSNYTVKDGLVSSESVSRLLWVSGHEIFHMLSPYSFPIWISESLAQYYGYKSLSHAGDVSQTPAQLLKSQVTNIPHGTSGLYEASEMVVSQNDMGYYAVFYIKGAAFWEEIDTALTIKGASLDQYISYLSGERKSDVQLNGAFVGEIEQVIGEIEFAKISSH